MFKKPSLISCTIILAFVCVSLDVRGQAGRGAGPTRRTTVLNVIVEGPGDRPVSRDEFDLYDSGIPQEVDSFIRLDRGSRIVLMVDSSANLRADLAALRNVVLALINELYEDDQMMIVGFNEVAEIIQDMTGDLKSLQAAAEKLERKGFPNLFDALLAVSDALSHQAQTGMEKRAIVLISDGYDSESKTKFDDALHALQEENIMLYAIQVTDRTRGALLRDKPKPPAALERLTVGTGGKIHPFEQAGQAAESIADELRMNWYRLTYSPTGVNPINLRRLLLMPRTEGLALRTKGSHPGRYR